MTSSELEIYIKELFPELTTESENQYITVLPDYVSFIPLMETLKNNPALEFNYLTSETCVDYKSHFTMVYHLYSRNLYHEIIVKVNIQDRANPVIDSVYPLWKTAELNEDEIYDLFGIRFNNHPNLRRLFMMDDWPGFPLRKDYTDKNMIAL